jgi:hypothetical protein
VAFRTHGTEEASQLYKRAISTGERTLGRDHPVIAGVLLNYAVVLRAARQSAQAKACERRAEAILKENDNRSTSSFSVDVSDLRRPSSLQ